MAHALISGGSSGIGLALARRLASSGWDISILARGAEQLAAAKLAIEASRRTDRQRVLPVIGDVRDERAVELAMQSAVAALGAPDLLVANAGVALSGTILETSSDVFRSSVEVNYLGSVYLVRAALPHMLPRRSGHIVLVSSGAGLVGIHGYGAYSPTKFALRGFGEVLRSELKPEGIRVSVVYPGDTDTPQLREEMRVRPLITAKIAGKARVHSAEDVAAAIMRGVDRGRFTITIGLQMALLARFHSLVAPLINRLLFDPIVARYRGRSH
jgi:3-dehydrosphinganine reductase